MDTPSPQDQQDIIRGGREITATLRAGGTKPVFVDKIPFLDIDTRLLPAMKSRKAEMLAYAPSLTAGELADLSDQSQIELLKVGRELNFFTLKSCMEFQQQELVAMGQGGLVEKLAKAAMENTPRPGA